MSRKIELTLNGVQTPRLKLAMFQFQGIQNAMNQFMMTNELEYSESHYKILTNTYVELYTNLQLVLANILLEYGHKNISVKTFDFMYDEPQLTITY